MSDEKRPDEHEGAEGEGRDAVEREIREAMDAEDGIPGAGDVEAPSDGDDSEAALERTHAQTGFRRAYLPLMVLLPALTYYLWICVTFYGGRAVVPLSWGEFVAFISHVAAPTWQAAAIIGGWLGLQTLLQAVVPGKVVQGEPLPDGRRLSYRMNGLPSFAITLGLSLVFVWSGLLPATLLADHFGEMLTTAHIFAFSFALFLNFWGKLNPDGGRVTGRPLYDYFMGTSRNPRIGFFDLKIFFEARPGLILWVLLNFSFAAAQLENHGQITTAMVLVCIFQFVYIVDYFVHERAILSTMDIKHENFGWMLCWGDFPWVPFTYSLQAMYLVEHTHRLHPLAIAGLILLNVAGYLLFRGVNSQKDRFRRDPDDFVWGKKPTYIKTKRGTLLLTSGFWGIARHLNYLGDLMMGLAWCLVCGFGSIIPYFYIIYFTGLLLHRQWRDDKMCQAKYGKSWDEYRRKVPWKIVPYVY